MSIASTIFITTAVTLAAWLSPQPQHSAGLILRYGAMDGIIQANADFRGYDLTPYKCAGSLMSPSDIGKIFYVRAYKAGWRGDWIGPCLSVDSAQRLHFADRVLGTKERVEVDDDTALKLGAYNGGVYGEVWIGFCTPPKWDYPTTVYPLPNELYDRYDPLGIVGYSTWTRVSKVPQTPVVCR